VAIQINKPTPSKGWCKDWSFPLAECSTHSCVDFILSDQSTYWLLDTVPIQVNWDVPNKPKYCCSRFPEMTDCFVWSAGNFFSMSFLSILFYLLFFLEMEALKIAIPFKKFWLHSLCKPNSLNMKHEKMPPPALTQNKWQAQTQWSCENQQVLRHPGHNNRAQRICTLTADNLGRAVLAVLLVRRCKGGKICREE